MKIKLSVRVPTEKVARVKKLLKGFELTTPNYGWIHATAFRSPKTQRLYAAMAKLNNAGFKASIKEIR